MRIFDGEKYRDMTAAEIEAVRKDQETGHGTKLSPEERLADLEASNAELREALDLILSGGIE